MKSYFLESFTQLKNGVMKSFADIVNVINYPKCNAYKFPSFLN